LCLHGATVRFSIPGTVHLPGKFTSLSSVICWQLSVFQPLWNVAERSRANIIELGEAANKPPDGEMRKV
jgi:hypothetical protein